MGENVGDEDGVEPSLSRLCTAKLFAITGAGCEAEPGCILKLTAAISAFSDIGDDDESMGFECGFSWAIGES